MATYANPFDEKKWAFAMGKALEKTLSDFDRSMDRLSTSDLEWGTVSFKDRRIYNGEYDVEFDRAASFVWLSVLFWGGYLFGGKICVKPSSLLKKLSQHVIKSGFVLYDTTDKERMETEHTFCFKIARNGAKIQGVKVDFSPVDAEPVSMPVATSAPVRPVGDVPIARSKPGLPGLALAASAAALTEVSPLPEEWQTIGKVAIPSVDAGKPLNRKERRMALFAAMSEPTAHVAEVQLVAAVAAPTPEVLPQVAAVVAASVSVPQVAAVVAAPVSVPQVAAVVAAPVSVPQTVTMTAAELSELVATAVSAAIAQFGNK